MEVDARNGAMMVMAKGMFSGAKISRGPDWQWGDQDGETSNYSVTLSLSHTCTQILLHTLSHTLSLTALGEAHIYSNSSNSMLLLCVWLY